MTQRDLGPAYDAFLAAADAAARARSGVDPELARELMGEAAIMLHNGLALDGLDGHDTGAVVAGLAEALVDVAPAAAVRARSQSALDGVGDLHDPQAASAAYLVAASILQL